MANDRPLAAHEILDALENVSDNEEDYRERLICILPPPVDPDCLTDEDSGEEDNVTLNNLPRNILLQPAEVMIQGQIMVSDTEEEPSDSTGRTKRRRTYAWRKRDLAKNPVNWPDVQGACQDNRIGIRGKKWYMPLLTHMIDLAEHNAWQLYKINHGKLDHLGFRRRVAIALIESNRKNVKRGPSRPSHHEHADSRKDQMNHLRVFFDVQSELIQIYEYKVKENANSESTL
ncbi:piggyBac transposable element-derived protein 3-like [Papilio machaon]|uniref:piggyBac transposable element-derived protein 3-like n=1 Tax=Papilio machaon TaxID=76193 RepID=UPI001E664558|nr:piggyBac transposable element-derived protein 3-like [Papilio machaon]